MSKILELANWSSLAAYKVARSCTEENRLLDAKARAALQAEVERMEAAHQQELAQVKDFWKECQARNRAMLDELNVAYREVKNEQRLSFRDQVGKLEAEIAALREDAERYRWLADYLVGIQTDVDDAIVAATDKQELDSVVDSARSKQ